MAVPIPPLIEQQEIAAEVAEKLSQIEAAETGIVHAVRRAARLRQSILKQAFAGRLVPQDPNDEPAAALLERIRAQADAPTPKPRARGKRTRAKT